MAKRLVNESLTAGHDTVLDGTGNSSIDKLEGKVNNARRLGAKRVSAKYVTLDTDEAIRRSDARGARTGRVVPHSVIRGTHASVSRVVEQAVTRRIFDDLEVWDNNGPTPRKIFEQIGNQTTVYDQGAWEDFLAKGSGGERAVGGVVVTAVSDLVSDSRNLAGLDDRRHLDGELVVRRLVVRGLRHPAVDVVDAGGDRQLHAGQVVGRHGGHEVQHRHPGHPDQKVHGKWASGRLSPVRGELKSGTVENNLSVGALNDHTVGAPKDGAWEDGAGVGDASAGRLLTSGGVTQEEAAQNLDRLAQESFDRAGGEPLPGQDWYEEGGAHAREHADEFGIDQEVAIGMTAAQSPMTEWSQNQVNADVAMDAVSRKNEVIPDDAMSYLTTSTHGKKALAKDGVELAEGETLASLYAKSPRSAAIAASQYGSTMDPARAQRLGLRQPIKTTASAGMPPWETSLRMGMSGDPGSVDGLLNGPKVRSFRNNLSDPFNSEDITIDTHMQRAATNTPGRRDQNWRSVKRDSTQMTSSPSYKGGADVGAHAALADSVRTATSRFNARNGTSLRPSQFQAVTWVEQIRQYPLERAKNVIAGKEPEALLGGPDRWSNQYGSGIITGVTDT